MIDGFSLRASILPKNQSGPHCSPADYALKLVRLYDIKSYISEVEANSGRHNRSLTIQWVSFGRVSSSATSSGRTNIIIDEDVVREPEDRVNNTYSCFTTYPRHELGM